MSTRSRALDALCVFLATGAYSGYAPKAPGTFGTLAAFILWIPLGFLPRGSLGLSAIWILGVLGLGLLGWGVTRGFIRAQGLTRETLDDQRIVIDEWIGLSLALLPWGLGLMPEHGMGVSYLIGFALFRLHDILKPYPINLIDQRMKTPLGVILDDALAGFISGLELWALGYLYPSLFVF